jgi:hypothetical protein
MKFQSIEELKEQLIKDRITVMDILKGHTGIPNQLRMSNNTGQL